MSKRSGVPNGVEKVAKEATQEPRQLLEYHTMVCVSTDD